MLQSLECVAWQKLLLRDAAAVRAVAVLQIASQQCVDQTLVDGENVREFLSEDALLSQRAVVRLRLQAAVHQPVRLVAVMLESELDVVLLVTGVVQL